MPKSIMLMLALSTQVSCAGFTIPAGANDAANFPAEAVYNLLEDVLLVHSRDGPSAAPLPLRPKMAGKSFVATDATSNLALLTRYQSVYAWKCLTFKR